MDCTGDFGWATDDMIVGEDESHLGEMLELEGAYSGKTLTTNSRVPGRLSKEPRFAEFYRDVLKAGSDVLRVMTYGYKIPFTETPPTCRSVRNNRSCRENSKFALDELHRLERLQCV